eukprot:EG_transcript_26026
MPMREMKILGAFQAMPLPVSRISDVDVLQCSFRWGECWAIHMFNFFACLMPKVFPEDEITMCIVCLAVTLSGEIPSEFKKQIKCTKKSFKELCLPNLRRLIPPCWGALIALVGRIWSV